VLPVKESDLIIPTSDPRLPIVLRSPQTLLIDIKILSHSKSLHPPTVSTIVGKLALVCMSLGNSRQLWVPSQLSHISSTRLCSRISSLLQSESHLVTKPIMHLQYQLDVLISNSFRQIVSITVGAWTLIRRTECVLSCKRTIILTMSWTHKEQHQCQHGEIYQSL